MDILYAVKNAAKHAFEFKDHRSSVLRLYEVAAASQPLEKRNVAFHFAIYTADERPDLLQQPGSKNHPNTTTTISTFADLLITYRSGLYFTVVDTRSVNSKCRTGKLPPLGNFSVLVTAGRRLCTRRLKSIVFLSLAHMPHKRCKISVPMKNWSCSVVHSADINIAIIKKIIRKAHAVGQR
jgi:hypothetical protein